MDDAAHQQRVWLRALLAQMNETPTGLARRAGIASSTLTRFLDDDSAAMLSGRTIAKLQHVANTTLPAPAAIVGVSPPGLAEDEGKPYAVSPNEPLAQAIAALVGSRPSADPWVLTTAHLTEAGILPGDIAIVDLAAEPRGGDVVCAQIYDWRAGRAETVFRLYEPPYLVAATRDRRVRRPEVVDNDRVVIKGVVTDLLRPLRPLT